MSGVNQTNANPNVDPNVSGSENTGPRKDPSVADQEEFVKHLMDEQEKNENQSVKFLGLKIKTGHRDPALDAQAEEIVQNIGVEKNSISDIASNTGQFNTEIEPEEDEQPVDAGADPDVREAVEIFANDGEVADPRPAGAGEQQGADGRFQEGQNASNPQFRQELQQSDDATDPENVTPGDITLAGMGAAPMPGQVPETGEAQPPSPADNENLSDLMVNTVSRFMISSPVAGGGEARMQFDPESGIPAKDCAIKMDAHGLTVSFTVGSDDDKAALEGATEALMESLANDHPNTEINVEIIVENPEAGAGEGGSQQGGSEQGSSNKQEYSGQQMNDE
ncbi:MAG: hypothetical protein AAF416_14565 [Pseudomonadota bacterium]